MAASLVGAYALGKAQRVIAELRAAGYHEPIYIHGAMQKMCELYDAHGVELGELVMATGLPKAANAAARLSLRRHPRLMTAGRGVCPIRLPRWHRAGCAFGSAHGRRNVELPLVISDHADWDELTGNAARTAPLRNLDHAWPHRRALRAGASLHQMKARALDLVGREDEDEG